MRHILSTQKFGGSQKGIPDGVEQAPGPGVELKL